MTATSFTARLPAAWRDFAAFLRAPAVAQPSGWRAPGVGKTVLAILALHLIGLVIIGAAMNGWMLLTGVEGPAAFAMVPTQYLIPLAIIGAPLFEEAVFRGWLTGRPRALWLLLCLALAALFSLATGGSAVMRTGGLVLVLLVAVAGWVVLRKRPTAPLFARNFGKIFFSTAIVFALIHVMNYDRPGLVHLPLVLPQLWAGLTLGFLRLRVGLPAAMLVHGLSNALALSLALAAGEV